MVEIGLQVVNWNWIGQWHGFSSCHGSSTEKTYLSEKSWVYFETMASLSGRLFCCAEQQLAVVPPFWWG